MDNPDSKVERVKLQGRETAKHILTVDDLITYRTDDGGMVIDFVRWGASRNPLESYRITVCPEDAERIRKA